MGEEAKLAPSGDRRQSRTVRANEPRELMWWAAAVAVVLLAFGIWQSRTVEIAGRVSLRSWDGAVSVPLPARAMVFNRGTLAAHVSRRLSQLPSEQSSAEAAVAEARRAWEEKSAAREEALRILRVAERSNAADLAACRAQYADAEGEANAAYAELEQSARRAESLADPAVLLGELPEAFDSNEVGPDGRFALRARVWHAPVVVVLTDAADGARTQAWLESLEVGAGGRVDVDFNNANLLTSDDLNRFFAFAGQR